MWPLPIFKKNKKFACLIENLGLLSGYAISIVLPQTCEKKKATAFGKNLSCIPQLLFQLQSGIVPLFSKNFYWHNKSWL